MLDLQDVHAYYGTSHILQGVSLNIGNGKCVALLGRNGAGKTTTVHTITGLVQAAAGKVNFMNQDICKLPPHIISRRGIGLVPQGRRIFPALTIRENLTIAARTKANNGEVSWDLEKVYEWFPVLKEREHSLGTQLSGGQQQMLAIARALMTNPVLLLMDEPSEGLAPVIIDRVSEVVSHLKETGLSILLVEQNISLACSVADEVLIMNKGTIVWNGTPDMLLGDEQIQRKFLGV